MAWLTAGEFLPLPEVWAFRSDLRNDPVLMDDNQIDSWNNTTWTSSISGVRIPADEQNERTIRKYGLKWSDQLAQGLTLEKLFRRLDEEMNSILAKEMETLIREVSAKIRVPFIVEGLLI